MTPVLIKMQILAIIFFSFCSMQYSGEASSFAAYQEKIVGGKRAASGEFPYQVSIKFERQHRCGGALITQRHVLTAAHCLVHYVTGGKFEGQLSKLAVVVGTANLFAPGQQYSVDAVFPHENYDNARVLNDIGIIKLTQNVTFSKFVDTVHLPEKTDLEPRTKLTMIGFGTYYTGDPVSGRHPISAVLRKVEVELISLGDCQESWQDTAVIRKTNICTSTDYEMGSCVGDSGGPLVSQGVIHGIVSYGEGYCADGVPDVATNVGSYLDWIEETLKIPDDPKPKEPHFGWYWGPQIGSTIAESDLDDT